MEDLNRLRVTDGDAQCTSENSQCSSQQETTNVSMMQSDNKMLVASPTQPFTDTLLSNDKLKRSRRRSD